MLRMFYQVIWHLEKTESSEKNICVLEEHSLPLALFSRDRIGPFMFLGGP